MVHTIINEVNYAKNFYDDTVGLSWTIKNQSIHNTLGVFDEKKFFVIREPILSNIKTWNSTEVKYTFDNEEVRLFSKIQSNMNTFRTRRDLEAFAVLM